MLFIHSTILSLVLLAVRASGQVFNCVGGTVYIVAHPDDDLLFQSPDLLTDIQASLCVTTIFLTSGDSGIGGAYAQSRESGNEAATAEMAGVADSYTEFNATWAGQVVLVRTLVGAPQNQKVWFRLPDGDVDGSGYAPTGYQTLRELYFGSISSITNQPGTATFTMGSLQLAIGQILTARQPDRIRTLDYLSQFDGGDHSDHLTTARITQILAANFAPNASVSGYMGYPIQNFAPTMATTSAQFNAKCQAFSAYAAYDSSECQTYAACSSAGRGEAYWLRRQYVVTPALATTTNDGSAQAPSTLPTGVDVARNATAAASSSGNGQPASAVLDGNLSGYPGNSSAEWSSNGGVQGTKLLIYWPSTYTITDIVLSDRLNVNDWMTGGTLTFSDFSTVSFGPLANDGSPTVIPLPGPINTSAILLTVTSVSATTTNVGLCEFMAYGSICSTCVTYPRIANMLLGSLQNATDLEPNYTTDLALFASATGSSSESSTSTPDKAIDGYVNGYLPVGGDETEEWASSAQGVGAWLQLNWASPVTLQSLVLYDRPNTDDNIVSGTITFSDGGVLNVPQLPNDGSPLALNFPAISTTSLRLLVTAVGPTTGAVGLAELSAYAAFSSNGTTVAVTYPSSSTSKSTTTKTTTIKTTTTKTTTTKTSTSKTTTTGKTSSSSTKSSSVVTSSTTSSVSAVPTAYAFANDLALNATASASSFSTGQPPSAAIDAVLGGYTVSGGDSTREWASNHQQIGAWFNLAWNSSIAVNLVVLYDRPNLNDQLWAGTLTFSDGTVVAVPTLNNDGSPTPIVLNETIITTSILLSVTDVSSPTTNVGLSEFQVFGPVAAISSSSLIIGSQTSSLPSSTGSSSTVPVSTSFYSSISSSSTSSAPTSGVVSSVSVTSQYSSNPSPNSIQFSSSISSSVYSPSPSSLLPYSGSASPSSSPSSSSSVISNLAYATNVGSSTYSPVSSSNGLYSSSSTDNGIGGSSLSATDSGKSTSSSASPSSSQYSSTGTGLSSLSSTNVAGYPSAAPGSAQYSSSSIDNGIGNPSSTSDAISTYSPSAGPGSSQVPVSLINAGTATPSSSGLLTSGVCSSSSSLTSDSGNATVSYYWGGSTIGINATSTGVSLFSSDSGSTTSTISQGATSTLASPTASPVSSSLQSVFVSSVAMSSVSPSQGTSSSLIGSSSPQNQTATSNGPSSTGTFLQVASSSSSSSFVGTSSPLQSPTTSNGAPLSAISSQVVSSSPSGSPLASGSSPQSSTPSSTTTSIYVVSSGIPTTSSSSASPGTSTPLYLSNAYVGSSSSSVIIQTSTYTSSPVLASLSSSTISILPSPSSVQSTSTNVFSSSQVAISSSPVPSSSTTTSSVTSSVISTSSSAAPGSSAVQTTASLSLPSSSSISSSNVGTSTSSTTSFSSSVQTTSPSLRSSSSDPASSSSSSTPYSLSSSLQASSSSSSIRPTSSLVPTITTQITSTLNQSSFTTRVPSSSVQSSSSSTPPPSSSSTSSSAVRSTTTMTLSATTILSKTTATTLAPSTTTPSKTITSSSSTSSKVSTTSSTTTKALTSASTSTTTKTTSTTASGATQSPGGSYSSINLVYDATISASSQDTADYSFGYRMADGIVGGYINDTAGDSSAEWSSNHGLAGTTLTLTWATAVEIAKVVLYDRPNTADQCTASTLKFSTGAIIQVASLPNDGSPLTLTFTPVSTTTLLWTCTAVSSTTSNVGLAELQSYALTTSPSANGLNPVNWARYATATASTFVSEQGPNKAIDNQIGGYTTSASTSDFTKEWATNGQTVGAWLLLSWSSTVSLSSLSIYDRPNTNDFITGATVVFSDGSKLTIPSLINSGSALVVNFPTLSTTSLLFTVTSVASSTSNAGLGELQAYTATSTASGAVTLTVGH